MANKKLIYGIIIIIFLALFFVGYYNYKKPGKYDDFAKCLTEKNIKFYGSFQCPHCANQKRIFSKSIKYVNYIECGPLSGPQNQICKDAGINSYPTWEINNTKISNVFQIYELSDMTGCKV